MKDLAIKTTIMLGATVIAACVAGLIAAMFGESFARTTLWFGLGFLVLFALAMLDRSKR